MSPIQRADWPENSGREAGKPVAGDSVESLEEWIAGGFPALEVREAEAAELAGISLDEDLLAARPQLPAKDFQKLEDEIAQTRIVYVRGEAAVPVTALIAIGGALLFHMLIAGGFFLALYLAVRSGGGIGTTTAAEAGGGSGEGYMIWGEAPQGPPAVSGGVEDLLAHAAPPPVPAAPALPSAAEAFGSGERLAAAELARVETDPLVIAIGSGEDRTGRMKPPPPPRRREVLQAVAPNNTLVVAPPERDAAPTSTTIFASAGSKGTLAASPRGGIGTGGDEDYGDEAIIPLSKADAGKGGQGGRGGRGGIDRGGSGANNPEPMILEWNAPEFELHVYVSPPPRSTKCKVTVLASGQVGKVEIVQSCGQKDLDALWRTALLHAKYRPAYRGGKPYEAEKDVECGFGK